MKASTILSIFNIVLSIICIIFVGIFLYTLWYNKNLLIHIRKCMQYPSLIEQLIEPDKYTKEEYLEIDS